MSIERVGNIIYYKNYVIHCETVEDAKEIITKSIPRKESRIFNNGRIMRREENVITYGDINIKFRSVKKARKFMNSIDYSCHLDIKF